MTSEPRERLRLLIEAARQLADPLHRLGKRARGELPITTGLSAQGIERALSTCLETSPTVAEIDRLLQSVPQVPRSHVLLSANVFTAAHRAIALALAASEQVFVRASRREPNFPKLLSEAAPGLFTLVDQLNPEAGDTLWAYGSDTTMAELQITLPAGVTLKSHGDGFGIVALKQDDFEGSSAEQWFDFSGALALDTALFDQRGCLSPRLIIAQGNSGFVNKLMIEMVAALSRTQQALPRGQLSSDEQADISWYRECLLCVGDWQETTGGTVSLVQNRTEPVPPPGRNLQVCAVPDVVSAVAAIAPWLTCVAHAAHSRETFRETLKAQAPHARHCAVGQMQRPPFDGPVDLRSVKMPL